MIEETWFKEKLSVQMSITKLLWVKKACRVPLVCLYSKRDPTRGACALCQPVVHLSVPSAPFVLIKRSAKVSQTYPGFKCFKKEHFFTQSNVTTYTVLERDGHLMAFAVLLTCVDSKE